MTVVSRAQTTCPLSRQEQWRYESYVKAFLPDRLGRTDKQYAGSAYIVDGQQVENDVVLPLPRQSRHNSAHQEEGCQSTHRPSRTAMRVTRESCTSQAYWTATLEGPISSAAIATAIQCKPPQAERQRCAAGMVGRPNQSQSFLRQHAKCDSPSTSTSCLPR